METGVEAVRLAIAGFIIPFIFVYHPDILIIDGFTITVSSGRSPVSWLATWMIGTALAGFDKIAASVMGKRRSPCLPRLQS